MLPCGLLVREIFEQFELESFAKTSGSKGLQIYLPLNTKTSYDETKPFAHALARLLETEHRDLVVSDMKKSLRIGKVLVDWSQNDEHKTTIAFIRCGRGSGQRYRLRSAGMRWKLAWKRKMRTY